MVEPVDVLSKNQIRHWGKIIAVFNNEDSGTSLKNKAAKVVPRPVVGPRLSDLIEFCH